MIDFKILLQQANFRIFCCELNENIPPKMVDDFIVKKDHAVVILKKHTMQIFEDELILIVKMFSKNITISENQIIYNYAER